MSDLVTNMSLNVTSNLDVPEKKLGIYAEKVQLALKEKKLESPVIEFEHAFSKEKCYKSIREHMFGILKALNLDTAHPDLQKTPDRVAKMYVHEIFSGLDYYFFPEPTFSAWEGLTAQNLATTISVDSIEFSSHCMHHFSMMHGKAKMIYKPRRKILGLSKVHRIFRFFASRPQLQELFTAQCLVAFQTILETDDVMVVVQANHGCVRSRGIRDADSMTRTIQAGGCFSKNFAVQHNFLDALENSEKY